MNMNVNIYFATSSEVLSFECHNRLPLHEDYTS